jgi:hypothetical protein
LRSTSIFSQHFMQPESSSPNSQELSICFYSEPDQSTPHHISSRSILIRTIHPPPSCYHSGLFPSGFPYQWPIRFPLLSHSSYMTRPSNPPRLDYSTRNYAWRRVQITKILVMQFSPSSPLILRRPKYPPQHVRRFC